MPDDAKPADSTAPSPAAVAAERRALHHLAFERNNDAAYDQWRLLEPLAKREALLDRHVFLAVMTSAAQRLGGPDTGSSQRRLSFADRIHALLFAQQAAMETRRLPFTIEWFEGLERWAAALLAQDRFVLAEQALQLAYDTGAHRIAGVHQALRATEALLLATTGRHDEAAQIALRYALRPYLLPDRRLRPQIYRRLMAALVLTGHVREYRALLWRGLADVYFDGATRAWFVQQVRATYRGVLGALLRAEVPAARRLHFALYAGADLLRRLRLVRIARLDRAFDWANFAFGYWLQYGRSRRDLLLAPPVAAADRILVTRAMGGLGDLLMMTPGLRALRRLNPQTPIHFAVPRSLFPLLQANTDVELVDVDGAELDPATYRAWYDLTDCPAARVESRQMPNVRRDRVQIFAEAMGVSQRDLQASGFAPRYDVSADEQATARAFIARANPAGRPLVGIQLHSAETYRDYPHMAALVADLAADHCVLLFHHLPVDGFEHDGVHKVVLPLRQSFAVAAQCALLVAPDSSFVHLGAAFGTPVIAIFGPIDGAVRCKRFPTVTVVAPDADDFPCSPCWRSEYTPCRLTGQRASACLRSIDPRALAARVRQTLRSRQ